MPTSTQSNKLPSKQRGFHRNKWLSEIAGAYGDLGTFLPLVMGILLLGYFDASGILVGFGVFAIFSGLIYRRPIPVQPMKAIAAYAIVGGLTPAAVMASGLLLGVILLVLGTTRLFKKLDQWIPACVLVGIQLGLGVSLIVTSLSMVSKDWISVILVVLLLLVVQRSQLKVVWILILLLAGISWSFVWEGQALPVVSFQWYWPKVSLPEWSDFKEALETAVFPQLAMTLTNAVLLTALVASQYFPENADRNRISPRHLAISTGFLNILLAPMGALPMCHGAGGLVAHYHLGARRGFAVIVFGVTCLLLGFLAGDQAIQLLALMPAFIVAGLLAYAGVQLSSPMKAWQQPLLERVITLLVAIICVLFNAGFALVAGVVFAVVLKRFASLSTDAPV